MVQSTVPQLEKSYVATFKNLTTPTQTPTCHDMSFFQRHQEIFHVAGLLVSTTSRMKMTPKKICSKKTFYCCTILKKYLVLIKNQLNIFFSYYFYLADKYSTYLISFVHQKNIFSKDIFFCQQVHGHSRFVTTTCHRHVTQNKKISRCRQHQIPKT